MYKIKILTITLIVLIASFTIYSCSKNEDNQISTQTEKILEYKQDNSKIHYSSKIINGRLNFSIEIEDLSTGKLINEKFDINIHCCPVKIKKG
jgi:hypothetical protein